MSEFSLTLVLSNQKGYNSNMAAKVQTKIEKVSARAGIFCAESYFHGFQLDNLLNEVLGVRSKAHNGFQWSEVILPLFDTCLCGGDYLEDVNEIGNDLRLAPGAHVPSSDTIGRAIKELAVEDICYTAKCSGQSYAFNTNPKLNGLLMESAIRMGLLKKGQMVDVDFDHVLIPCDKADAKYSYKQAYGYFPGVYSIDGVIAYVENRDGNTPVKFRQADTHRRAFSLFRQKGQTVRQFRADCGSYSEEVVKVIDDNCLSFYLRAANSQSLYAQIQRGTRWTPAEINYQKCEVASVMFSQFLEDRHYRLVVQRTKVEDGEGMEDLFGGKYVYRCILTNDWERTEQDIITIYNKRGAMERDFDSLNNDFMWKHLPCSYLKENTAFMILMAMCKNFFTALMRKLSGIFHGITPNGRLKRFVFHFITVPGKWIRTARTWKLKLYTDRPYEKLVST